MAEQLNCEHFAADVVVVARDLVGRTLTVTDLDGARAAVIVETEAYAGKDDPASHAAFRPGGRAAAMFGSPGTIYIYAAYGMYPCLNVVTGPAGEPSAVLIRAVLPLDGSTLQDGPGRAARWLGVTLDDHGATACGDRFAIGVGRVPSTIAQLPRVGITRGIEFPWRFRGLPSVGDAG